MQTNSLREWMQQASPNFQELSAKTLGKYSPAEIRMTIQQLAAEGEMPLAQALVDAGLSLYPDNQDMLAMGGLMALTQQDWGDAVALLEQLLQLQGQHAPAMTYQMLVRALRCNLEPARAQRVLTQGLLAWPDNAELKNERDEFLGGPAVMPAPRMSN